MDSVDGADALLPDLVRSAPQVGGGGAPEEGARSVGARYEVNLGQQNREEGEEYEWCVSSTCPSRAMRTFLP